MRRSHGHLRDRALQQLGHGSTRHPDSGKSQLLTDEQGSHFTRGSLLTELKVPLHPSFSLYAVIGDWGVIGLTLLGFAMVARRR